MPFTPANSLAHGGRRLLLGLICASGLGAVHADELVRINGTGSGVGGLQILAVAFKKLQPGIRVEVQPAIGSSGGINALIAGQIELAVANRAATEGELARAPLLSVEYARTPFVLAVHPSVGVTDLSLAQVAALYAEPAAQFPNGRRARPVLRPSDMGDMNKLKAFSPEVAAAVDAALQRRGMLTASTDSEAADAAEQAPGAVALSSAALIESEKRNLVAISLDGKPATVAALLDGRYPHFKPLFLVLSLNAGEAARKFAAFVQSSEGKALLRANGHAPR